MAFLTDRRQMIKWMNLRILREEKYLTYLSCANTHNVWKYYDNGSRGKTTIIYCVEPSSFFL